MSSQAQRSVRKNEKRGDFNGEMIESSISENVIKVEKKLFRCLHLTKKCASMKIRSGFPMRGRPTNLGEVWISHSQLLPIFRACFGSYQISVSHESIIKILLT